MTEAKVNLRDAILPRACAFAEAIASRLPDAGLWTGYTAAEGLDGELRFENQLNYWRKGQPHAVLVFVDPVMHDLKDVDWGEESVVERNVVERDTEHLEVKAGAVFDDTVTHTFSKTRSLLEAAKVGMEAAVKASANASYAGVSGGVEVSAKVMAEYSRQWGGEETETDTVSRHFKIEGPWTGVYEAVRSLNKTQRLMSARTDFDFGRVGFIDETGAGVNPPRIYMNWRSWSEVLAVGMGIAPADRTMYREFMRQELSADELAALSAPSAEVVSSLVEYDHVVDRDIRIV